MHARMHLHVCVCISDNQSHLHYNGQIIEVVFQTF